MAIEVVIVVEIVDGILDGDSTAETTGLGDEEKEVDKHVVNVIGTAETTTEQREEANTDDFGTEEAVGVAVPDARHLTGGGDNNENEGKKEQ